MDRLLVVDGSNLLFQMFYGMPSRIVNREGKAIQGTLGFVGALLKMIRMTEPTHVAVLFDGEYVNQRTELDGDYKANRVDYAQVPEEESPFSQLPDIYDALDYLGLRHAETTVCETDDWIAGFALTYGREQEVVIASQDSDFFQLITDKVSVLRYRGDKTVRCDPTYIRERLGIEPVQYADHKALTGDASDNIRGADKIGSKTSTALLSEYGTLENIINHAESIKKASIRASVLENAERLRKNYKLIRLSGGVELPFELGELIYCSNEITTNEVLKGIGLR